MEHAIHKWNGNKIKSEELTAAANGEVEVTQAPKMVICHCGFQRLND